MSRLHRSYLTSDSQWLDDRVTLDERESHHLAKVLRAREGDEVEVFDGRGEIHRCRLIGVSANRLEILQIANAVAAEKGIDKHGLRSFEVWNGWAGSGQGDAEPMPSAKGHDGCHDQRQDQQEGTAFTQHEGHDDPGTGGPEEEPDLRHRP